MPSDIKLSRVPHKVMIDAVMRRMVHTHYEEISKAHELCRISQEPTCDGCTICSPKSQRILGPARNMYMLEAPGCPYLNKIYVRGFMQQSHASALAMRALGMYL